MLRENPAVAIIMGSQSDWNIMQHAQATLDDLKIPSNSFVMSAHRTPERLYSYAKDLEKREIEVVIAGAGGAAHLPGMIAALTQITVLGVPVESKILKGLDSLLSIVQMPAGIPLPTLSIGEAGATNAALSAASILSIKHPEIKKKLIAFRSKQTKLVKNKPTND